MTIPKQVIATTIVALLAAGALFYLTPEKLEGEENLTNLKCIGRSTIISRGQNWVDKHVPYNQGGTYDGYRTDCSGFVSMAWMLSKPGLTTYTMGSVSHGISKDSLAAGDAMNCASRHILLFAGWSDSSRTHYVSMEQANSKTGTVKRVTPYPYWNGDTCFKPIRYNNVC